MPAAVVLFGDVIRSRRDAPAATAWLRTLAADLDGAYPPDERLAPFEFTQGDELQGLLAPAADPLGAILRAALHPERSTMRWVVVAGDVDPGHGPATQRSGPAFIAARERLGDRRGPARAARGRQRRSRDRRSPRRARAARSATLLADLTDRQREIAWPILVEGLRRSEAAERLGVSRATISVAADRAHLRAIGDLARVVRTLLARATMTP